MNHNQKRIRRALKDWRNNPETKNRDFVVMVPRRDYDRGVNAHSPFVERTI